jgi:hypothetical protein
MNIPYRHSAIAVVAMLAAMPASHALTTVDKNPQNGLLTYSASTHGFSIELIQVIPDFIRAIYGKHDFPKQEIEQIANYCVYGSVIKNTTDKTLTYKVADWHYVLDGKTYPVKTKSQWLAQWRKAGVVFSWTLLPDVGEFYEGDWQQGFTTIKAPRNSHFDLIYRWQLDGIEYSNTLENMQCPPVEIEADQ